jgi:hypothetical protein
MTKAQTL